MKVKKIKSVKIIEEDTHKYSINVENNHNYFSTGKLLSKNCLMILDEAQNSSFKQLMLFVTRMGKGSKVIVTGDISQYDIAKQNIGLESFINLMDGIKGIANHTFTEKDIVRAKILQEVVKRYDKWKLENE